MLFYNTITKQRQQGIKPIGRGWVEVVSTVNNYETDYPKSFHYMTSSKSLIAKVEGIYTSTSTWKLSSVEVIQQPLYEALKAKRDVMLFGEVTVNGVTIFIEDQRDIDVVLNLGNIPVNFKRGTGDRVTIDIADGILFKKAYQQKVQDAFNWEEIEEIKITSADTHDKLKTLIEA